MTAGLMLASMALASLAAASEGQAKAATCRWSWQKLRCVPPADSDHACAFNWRRVRCEPRPHSQPKVQSKADQSMVQAKADTEREMGSNTENNEGEAGSKAAASKVAPTPTAHAAPQLDATPQQQAASAQAAPAQATPAQAAPAQASPAQAAAAQPTAQQAPQGTPQPSPQPTTQPTPQQATPQQATPQQPQQRPWLPALQRGMMLQQRERWAEAVPHYEEAISLFDPAAHSAAERMQFGVTANTNLGLALQNAGRATEAVAAFDAALEVHPSNGDGHHNRGNALYASGQYELAVQAYTRAVTISARDAESYFRLGNAHDKLDQPEAAVAAFSTALAIEPADPSAAYNLANAYRTLGQTDDAIKWYRESLKATPRDAAKHANLGHAYDSAARFDEATAAFVTSLEIDPTDAGTYTSLGHAHKSSGRIHEAAAAYRAALAIAPDAAGAYAGLGSALKQIDPKAAAEAFAAAASSEEGSEEATQAKSFREWIDASPPPLPSARGVARQWQAVAAAAKYPEAFEGRAGACPTLSMSEAIQMGHEALIRRGPTMLTNATVGWRLSAEWDDSQLTAAVGGVPMRMLVMPTDVHPTLDVEHSALVEPAASGVYFSDYLRLLDRLADTEEFAVYVAQLNLLRLPPLLKQVCLPEALPGSKLTMTNLWVGGHSMKNGLHFDNYDNLLHQLAGSKRALLFPPEDAPHLYYASEGANIRRHAFSLDKGFENETVHEAQRKNVAMINVFDENVGSSHPTVYKASPTVCELRAGDALFLPKGWHHAVISAAEGRRNLAVNTWYDLRGQSTPVARVSSLEEMFQADGCDAKS